MKETIPKEFMKEERKEMKRLIVASLTEWLLYVLVIFISQPALMSVAASKIQLILEIKS